MVATRYKLGLQLSVTIIIVFSVSTKLHAQDRDNQLKIDASSGWAKMKEKVQRPMSLRVTINKENSRTKVPWSSSFMVEQAHDAYLLEITKPSGIKGDRFMNKEVQSMNSRYSFVAKDIGTGWVLSHYEPTLSRTNRLRDTATKFGLNYQELAWTVGGHSFPEVFDTPGFKAISYEPGGTPLTGPARLTFSIPITANPSKDLKVGIDRGVVEFDPRHDWRMTKYEYQMPVSLGSGLISGKIQYRDLDGLVSKVEQSTKYGDKYQTEVVIITDSLELRDVPESEFTLSAYGLPEPEGVVWQKPATPLYVWLLVAAGSFALVAALCRWAIRRNPSSPTPHPTV